MAIQSDWTEPSGDASRRPEHRHGVIRRVSDRRRVAIGALGEWMIRRQKRPVFLVDQTLTVICSNVAAQDALHRIGWMRQNDEQLEILDPDLRGKLPNSLATWPKPGSATIRLNFGKRALDLTVLELTHGLPKVYVMEIIQPLETSVISRLLVKKFRLSKVQARVAVLVYDGGNLKSVAARLDLSVNTVKSHMREIFNKVGVRSQRELVREVGDAVDRS